MFIVCIDFTIDSGPRRHRRAGSDINIANQKRERSPPEAHKFAEKSVGILIQPSFLLPESRERLNTAPTSDLVKVYI